MDEQLVKQIDEVLEKNGWDQPHLLYLIKNGEFIQVASFTEHPIEMINYLMKLHENDSEGKYSTEGTEAVFLCTEGWTYPEDIFGDGGPALTQEETEMLWSVFPPSVHPKREEVRNVALVTKEFDAYNYTRTRPGRVLMLGKNGEDTTVSGPVFDALIEYAKAVIK